MRNLELQLNIISAEKKIFSGMVSSVIIPGISGKFGVYPDHAPLISLLKEGVVTYMANGAEQLVEVNGGIAEVMQNVITICVS
jgi:F-type H+-transporting ATPase subunit epsilon